MGRLWRVVARCLHAELAQARERGQIRAGRAGEGSVRQVAPIGHPHGVVFTSSTSAFGRVLTPASGQPTAWITEDVPPVVRNIYGATKIAAEDLCELAARDLGIPVIVLRTSRFFPEQDDRDAVRRSYEDTNLKVNEFLYRRVDLADVVDAHLLAAERAPTVGFARYIISATTPFSRADLGELAVDAPAVLARLFPGIAADYHRWGWLMFPKLDRVYVNERARQDLGWTPRYGFPAVVELVRTNGKPRSPLAAPVGAKGYHCVPTGVYTL